MDTNNKSARRWVEFAAMVGVAMLILAGAFYLLT
jgi:hypothetical protein